MHNQQVHACNVKTCCADKVDLILKRNTEITSNDIIAGNGRKRFMIEICLGTAYTVAIKMILQNNYAYIS